ncbi:MAG TPA: preprotein translocase subunit SecG [Candidatus Peribacteraceae bacterium]|nr:preprotein translocase subunit SecG [Candidatus Peribacteraceae bacterium]
MQAILEMIQAIMAILLLASILIQHRVSGLSATFGGSGSVVVQRRGAERVIYRASIWLAVVFFGLSILRWYL